MGEVDNLHDPEDQHEPDGEYGGKTGRYDRVHAGLKNQLKHCTPSSGEVGMRPDSPRLLACCENHVKVEELDFALQAV